MHLVQGPTESEDFVVMDGSIISTWPTAGMMERIVVFFPEAWEYSDHYVVTCNFKCHSCSREKTFTLRLTKFGDERMFGCKHCEHAIRRRVKPLKVY